MNETKLNAYCALVAMHGDSREDVSGKTGYSLRYVYDMLSGRVRMSDRFERKLRAVYKPDETIAAMSAALGGNDDGSS